jgi:ferredoxin
MPRVEIVNVEASPTIQLDTGRRLVLAIEDAGIDILHRCGGNARCTTCRVEILSGDPGPMTEAEITRLAREENLAPNTRLSCQIADIQSDLTINVINRLSTSGLEDPGPRPVEW